MKPLEFLGRYFRIRKCGGCGRILSFEECLDAFCPDCRLKWNRAKTESCPRCLQSMAECTCQPSLLSGSGVVVHRKLFVYSARREYEPQNRILYQIKRQPNRRLIGFLASELRHLAEQEMAVLAMENPAEEAILVWVPRARKSKAIYGFDHAEQLCRHVSGMTGIPLARVLCRKPGGRTQKSLSKKERARNMRKKIFVREAEAVKGKCVFLVDDVVTTGASMSACASALKKAGARCVIALSLAQTL